MGQRVRHVRDVLRLAQRAMREGAVLVRPRVLEWDVSRGCESPYPVTIEGRSTKWGDDPFHPHARPNRVWYGDGFDSAYGTETMWIDMRVPCRRCGKCRDRRARLWTYRSRVEISAARRTWFGTLTLAPEAHYVMQARAAVRLGEQGTSFVRLSSEEQFAERVAEVGRELTLWLKRVRKESGASLRYILVAEAHKSGLPHWHALVHERGARAVGERTLRLQWPHGHSQFKLVHDVDAAWYVCKYLNKSAMARVRASQHYGSDDLIIIDGEQGETS